MANFYSKYTGYRVKLKSGWVIFTNGTYTSQSETEAKQLRESDTFGVDFYENSGPGETSKQTKRTKAGDEQ